MLLQIGYQIGYQPIHGYWDAQCARQRIQSRTQIKHDGEEQLQTTRRTIKQNNTEQNNTEQNDENGWSTAVRGLGPVHQRKFPRHQPVCPGDPHSSRMHHNGNHSNISVTEHHEQLRRGCLTSTLEP